MIWEKRRGEESLPLFSRGRIKPLIFKSYLPLQWAPLLLTRNQPTGFALRFGLLVLIERWAGVWTELLWFGEPSGPPGLRSLIHQEFGCKLPKYLTQHFSHFNVQVGLALESRRWVRVLHFQHSPQWGGQLLVQGPYSKWQATPVSSPHRHESHQLQKRPTLNKFFTERVKKLFLGAAETYRLCTAMMQT